jgi:uncharacterized protein (TIGR04255 family)
MVHRCKYKKPPVVEALCEIYFSESVWDDTVPGRFYEQVNQEFPAKRSKEIQQAEFAFNPSGEASAALRRLPSWMQFVSEKNDRMIQLARDLLVVNQLPPYPRFEAWEPVIYDALKKYRDSANPKAIRGVGLRYLNRVVIPKPRIKMEDYFTLYPQLPQGVENAHRTFLVRVEVPQTKQGHTLVITFGTADPPEPNTQAFLLDLYALFQPDCPMSFDAFSDVVGTAHDNVIAAFEGSLTDRLRLLFEPEGSP